MQIPVVGFDPSLRNWGIARAVLDLSTGYLDELNLTLVETEKGTAKQVRQNSDDLQRAEDLARAAIEAARPAKAIFVEVPVGSQNASGMKSYGVCVGILAAIRALGIPVIEVTPSEVKKTFTNDRNATKELMIKTAVGYYPNANWHRHRGEIQAKNEHLADAIAAIHAGVMTPVFQNLMRLFAEV